MVWGSKVKGYMKPWLLSLALLTGTQASPERSIGIPYGGMTPSRTSFSTLYRDLDSHLQLTTLHETPLEPDNNATQVSVINWNLENYGTKKAQDGRLEMIAHDVRGYDIIFLQEIVNKDARAIHALQQALPEYNFHVSSRAGGSRKEQIALAHKKHIELVDSHDYNPDHRFSRPPIRATFSVPGATGPYLVNIMNIHINPLNAVQEVGALEDLVAQEGRVADGSMRQGNWMVLGDLNYDCSYAEPEKLPLFDTWYAAIGDDEDTTTTTSDCAYDRAYLNADAAREFSTSILKTPSRGHGPRISERLSNHKITGVILRLDLEQLP